MTNHTVDFINALTSPDRRYGEVPFYWWNGDPLEKERLTKQLEQLSEKGLAGVQINYAHLNGGGEEGLPFGGHGKSIPGTPEQFSEEWWEFFSHAAKECERLGMSIGMGDYTIAWVGNGYFTDKISNTPGMNARNLSCERKMLFSGDEESFSDKTLAVIYYSDMQCEKPVIIYEKGKGVISPIPGISEAYIIEEHITENSIDPMNPDCGKLLVEYFFMEFERRLPELQPGTLNYFFQDELMFGADTGTLWSDSLRKGIEEKYSYDLLGFLPHLFYDLGNITPKIRLDIADVKTEIMENCYFKPIYQYHSSRGMIYGCDQSGRGKDPAEFSDYFRTVRWFTAPGNDTPGRAADLIKVKVNSSIAHLYNRPRVWLEGYHSSGWGTTLESITAPTSDNFIFGANLLNLHGLYYSTNGGFFEWAPPDFHFRMPYWDDEKNWLDKYKRLSQLLTTGKHRCDAAIYYPVSSCDYGENHESCIETTFNCAEYLFSNGVDFDFIDFQSITNAKCENGRIITPEEEYKVLIFAGVDCIRYSSIIKAKELMNAGGCVIFCGLTPYASDRKGKNDDVLANDIIGMLSHPNCILAASPKEALNFINSRITRSFLPENMYSDEKVYVHTRIHGDDKLFFVRYAPKDSVCRFEAEGIPYLLDSENGEIIRLSGTVATEGFSFIKMPLTEDKDTLILFTYDDIDFDKEINTSGFSEEEVKEIISLDGYWDFSLIPTLDNTYGDFYLPKGGIIGAQARFFDVSAVKDENEIPENYEYSSLPYCTSAAIKKIHCSKNQKELCAFLYNTPDFLQNNSFVFEDNDYIINTPLLHERYYYHSEEYTASLHEQGHHGLKGRVYDDNIIFTEDCIFATFVYSEEDQAANLIFGDIKPEFTLLNGKETQEGKVFLNKGKNLLLLSFNYDKNTVPNYRNNGEIKRTSVHITKEDPKKCTEPLSVSSFANPDYFRFSGNDKENTVFCYKVNTVPALCEMEMNIFGELLCAYNNGENMDICYIGKGNFGGNKYSAKVKNISPDVSEAVFYIKAQKGFEYTSVIPEPVSLTCTKGRILLGDLTKTGALINYSGKVVYEKEIELQKLYPDEKFYIDIEDAAATLNIEINGKTAAVFTYRPFSQDITPFIVHGNNHIKITVSNTLCNHYSTIPSKYSNFPRDASFGLIGPVHIRITEKTY
ncbi:MAG: hypothetical protein IKL10_05020 [Clostridia bacterium]|nr:hypothetical protein [Clostridia bacterium]